MPFLWNQQKLLKNNRIDSHPRPNISTRKFRGSKKMTGYEIKKAVWGKMPTHLLTIGVSFSEHHCSQKENDHETAHLRFTDREVCLRRAPSALHRRQFS
jgi:hypothetical protein